jgi:hypothetical protein
MWYVRKFDEATWHLLASAGLTGKRIVWNKQKPALA